MDAQAFAAWTRRRLGLAASGVLAACLGLGLDREATARKCKGGKKTCGAKCIGKHKCCGGCGDQHCCKGKCVDLATSVKHCGACGNACPSGACLHGACTCQNVDLHCPAGVACACGLATGGGAVCYTAPFQGPCDGHGDCPVGSACLVNDQCSGPCLG